MPTASVMKKYYLNEHNRRGESILELYSLSDNKVVILVQYNVKLGEDIHCCKLQATAISDGSWITEPTII